MRRGFMTLLLVVVLVGGVLGCGEKSDNAEQATLAADAEVIQVSVALAAHLEKADGVDGTTDHIVSNCSGCKLKMAGSSSNTIQVGEYTMQFCSAECKDNFAEGGEEAIMALQIPEEEGHEGHGH
jgi:hypothetical protein